MTENQKLREALQAVIAAHEAGMREIGERMRAANQTSVQIEGQALIDAFAAIEQARQALALPTAAPDMPLSMNQFGRLVELTREHLTDNTFVYKATSKAGDTCHFGVESAAKAWAKGGTVEAIKVREFKLHTSALTAAPVSEREAFEQWWKGDLVDWRGHEAVPALHAWAAWQARAALSAGDAVDAQRLDDLRRNAWSLCSFVYVPASDSERNIGWRVVERSDRVVSMVFDDDPRAAIDAAIRKGQL